MTSYEVIWCLGFRRVPFRSLTLGAAGGFDVEILSGRTLNNAAAATLAGASISYGLYLRSEERRVGKECRSLRLPNHEKINWNNNPAGTYLNEVPVVKQPSHG